MSKKQPDTNVFSTWACRSCKRSRDIFSAELLELAIRFSYCESTRSIYHVTFYILPEYMTKEYSKKRVGVYTRFLQYEEFLTSARSDLEQIVFYGFFSVE